MLCKTAVFKAQTTHFYSYLTQMKRNTDDCRMATSSKVRLINLLGLKNLPYELKLNEIFSNSDRKPRRQFVRFENAY